MTRLFLIWGLIVFTAPVFATGTNLIELHKNTEKSSNKECLACHQGITKQTTLDPKIKTFHRLHLESKRNTPKDCSDCHQSTDLRNGSAAALRRQVDPQVCAGCHSGGVAGIKVLFEK
jgi:hypothetical protein